MVRSRMRYLPGYALFSWKTATSYITPARFTSILFDPALPDRIGTGREAVRREPAGGDTGVRVDDLPFTLYALCNNTNDTVQAAFLIWGFWLCSSPVGRGAFGALAGWAKFAPLIVAPMWATYPNGVVRSRTP